VSPSETGILSHFATVWDSAWHSTGAESVGYQIRKAYQTLPCVITGTSLCSHPRTDREIAICIPQQQLFLFAGHSRAFPWTWQNQPSPAPGPRKLCRKPRPWGLLSRG
jgi:hypothetical protein